MRPFDYLAASDLAGAQHTLQEGGAALAGGTNLVDLMRLHVQNVPTVVDVSGLPLAAIEKLPNGLRLGALSRNSDVANHEDVKQRFPVLSEALLAGASPQIRNMATTAGNLMQRTRCAYFRDTSQPCNKRVPGSGCGAMDGWNRMHAILGTSERCIALHPSDMCVALAMLDCTVVVRGPRGERRIPIGGFHLEPAEHPEREHALQPGELITAVELLDAPFARRSGYLKVRDRSSFAFALASAAVGLELEGTRIRTARVALGGVGTRPWRSIEAERALTGQEAGEVTFKAAAEAALQGAKVRKHNAFKVQLARATLVQTLSRVAGTAS